MTNKKENSLIAYNAVIQIIGRIFFLALSLVNVKLITNYLLPSGFGEYATVLTFTGFFTVLIDLGLFHVAIREISKARERAQEILSNVLTIRLLSAVLATLLVIFLGYALPQYRPIGTGILVGALAMFVYFLTNILDIVFHVNLKMQYIAVAELVSKISTLIAVYIAIILDWGLVGIIGAILFGSVVAVLPRVIIARRFIQLKLAFDPKICVWLLKLALPLGLVFILNNIYFKIDSQMLYLLSTTRDAGLYGIAYRLLETTLFISAFVVAAITPSLSRTIGSNTKVAQNLVSRAFEILLAAGLLLFVSLSIFAKPIIVFISDTSYIEGARAVPMLAAVVALMYVNGLFGQILIAADRRKILVTFSIILVLFNIGLNLILIPRYGFIGAAWSTLISELGVLIFNLIVTSKIMPLKLNMRTILVILLATTLSTLIFISLDGLFNWLIVLILGFIFYLGILWQFKFLNLSMMKEIIRKE